MTEEEDDSTVYQPLGRKKHTLESDTSEPANNPPEDTKNFVYLSLLACGIGFVLPYSSFIVAADYWQERFKGKSVALDMSLSYILTAFATVLVSNLILSWTPFKARVIFGYTMSFLTLLFITICEIGFHVFSKTTAYSVCLSAVCLVSLGCTVQQSSFYGFSSIFPRQYTQAIMAGESVAGLLVSTNRIITKLLIYNERLSTVIFFFTSIIYIIFSFVLHILSMKTPFVQYYMQQCSKIVFKLSSSNVPENSNDYTNEPNVSNNVPPMSFSNPLYDPSLQNGSNSEIQVFDIPNVGFNIDPDVATVQHFRGFKRGLISRWKVARSIYPYMASIALAYCITLSLYPGIESEIVSCKLRSWMPVLLMFTFNAADVLGKVLAAVPYAWSRRQLILMSTLRIIIVPLLLLCCAPRRSPIINGETAAFVFTAAFGLTNGMSGSLPMMLAPTKVPATLKEIAGNMMTLSYNIGLTVGSLIGYVFDNILGEQVTDLSILCPVFPYSSYKPPVVPQFISTSKATRLVTSTVSALLSTTTESIINEKPSISSLTSITNSILFESTTSTNFENFTDYGGYIAISTIDG